MQYDTLREKGVREPVPMTINGLRGWHTWSLRISERMERLLLDKGRFNSGVQTFLVRRFLTVPQCGRCLRYGHETCQEKPCCFKCGSEEPQARRCEVIPDHCIPCQKEGLESRHRGTRYCGSYKRQLDIQRGINPENQEDQREVQKRQQETKDSQQHEEQQQALEREGDITQDKTRKDSRQGKTSTPKPQRPIVKRKLITTKEREISPIKNQAEEEVANAST